MTLTPALKPLFKIPTVQTGAPSLRWIGSASADYATTTDLSVTIPTEAEAGDLLVLGVMHRTTLTAPSTGWTLVNSGPESLFNQQTVVGYSIYNGTDTTVTATQSSSERMGLCLLVLRSSTGNFTITDHQDREAATPSVSITDYLWPAYTNNLAVAGAYIAAHSWPIAATEQSTAGEAFTNTSPVGNITWSKAVQTSITNQNRMLGRLQFLAAGEAIQRLTPRFTATTNNTDNMPGVELFVSAS